MTAAPPKQEVKITVDLADKRKPEIVLGFSQPSGTIRLTIDQARGLIRAINTRIREHQGLPRTKQPPTR